MIDPKEVSGVLVTRGNSDIWPIAKRLACLGEVIIWDNSRREDDLKVFGRYAGAAQAKNATVYFQDDDCLIDVEKLCSEYQAPELLCNVLPSHQQFYKDRKMSLVGWGALCPRDMVAFDRYLGKWPKDELFLRECDRVFTRLNPCRMVDFGVQHLSEVQAKGEMWRESRHAMDLEAIINRLAKI